MSNKPLYRVRFYANLEDYRPIKWPIKYPYWCTGYTANHSTIIAYVTDVNEITELWPEAVMIDPEEVTTITFTDRFPKPDWFDETKVNIPTRDLQKE